MISRLLIIFLLSGSIGFATTDGFRPLEDSEVDARALKWGARNLKLNGAAAQHEALASWRQGIANSEKLPREQAIEFLGEAVRKTSDLKFFQVKERIDVQQAAQTTILAIPGHAEYYRDRLLEARRKVDEAKAGGGISEIGVYRSRLDSELRYHFSTLAYLPSVETVQVLGEFLYDERGYVKMPDKPTMNDLTREIADSPVFPSAAIALLKLPLLDKPVPATEYPQYRTPEDVKPWRQWYEEIKSGKRTFRFEGDPTEYDLNGPAPKEKLERIALNRRMESDRAARHGRNPAIGAERKAPETSEPASRKSLVPAMILAALAALAAVWYFAKGRGRRNG